MRNDVHRRRGTPAPRRAAGRSAAHLRRGAGVSVDTRGSARRADRHPQRRSARIGPAARGKTTTKLEMETGSAPTRVFEVARAVTIATGDPPLDIRTGCVSALALRILDALRCIATC